MLECGLDEDLKWGKPCFMFEDKNVAIITVLQRALLAVVLQGIAVQGSKWLAT